MPWKPAQAATKTKKASTKGKKQKWSTIANAALRSGKSDASAIKIANAALNA